MTDLDLIESRLREHFDEFGEALQAVARVRARVAELEAKSTRYENALIEIAAGNPAPPDKIASQALHP